MSHHRNFDREANAAVARRQPCDLCGKPFDEYLRRVRHSLSCPRNPWNRATKVHRPQPYADQDREREELTQRYIGDGCPHGLDSWTDCPKCRPGRRAEGRGPVNSADLSGRMVQAAHDLSEACRELEIQARAYAEAERHFRREHAKAYLRAEGTGPKRDAEATLATETERYQRDLAEGLKLSALEAVRSYRATLSSLQTIGNLAREEAQFYRTGPSEVAG